MSDQPEGGGGGEICRLHPCPQTRGYGGGVEVQCPTPELKSQTTAEGGCYDTSTCWGASAAVSSPAGRLHDHRRRLPSDESSTSRASPPENFLGEEAEAVTLSKKPENPESASLEMGSDSLLRVETGGITLSKKPENPESASLEPHSDSLLRVEDRSAISNQKSSNKRYRGKGTGRIQIRIVTSKTGKQYEQAWYDWEVSERGRTVKRSTYIPKRLSAKVHSLEAAKASVHEVLKVLGVRRTRNKPSTYPVTQTSEIPDVFLGEISDEGQEGSKSPKKISQPVFLGEIEGGQPDRPKSPKKISQPVFLGEILDEGQEGSKSPKKNPSGHLSPVVQRKKDGKGQVVEYPRVEGERVPLDQAWDNPHQFIWLYNWSVREGGRWRNKSKSVPVARIGPVREAIAAGKTVGEILALIEQP